MHPKAPDPAMSGAGKTRLIFCLLGLGLLVSCATPQQVTEKPEGARAERRAYPRLQTGEGGFCGKSKGYTGKRF